MFVYGHIIVQNNKAISLQYMLNDTEDALRKIKFYLNILWSL